MPLSAQIVWLFLLAIPVACVSWTVTHEEILREPREYCEARSRTCQRWWQRKFFYVWTCEYCLSHYVSAAFVAFSGFTLLRDDWRGAVIAWLAVVWIANQYMSLYNRIRLEIKVERIDLDAKGKGQTPP